MAETTPKVYGFWGLIWRMTLAGMLVLGASSAGGYFAVKHLVETPEVEVPDLLTLELADAMERASDEGFSLQLQEREATGLLAPGTVLAQHPSPGAPVKSGATIRVTLAAAE